MDRLAQAFASAAIGARAYYRVPVHRQPAMQEWGSGKELPVTEELARTHLAIPMSPVLSADDAAEVTRVASEALATAAR